MSSAESYLLSTETGSISLNLELIEEKTRGGNLSWLDIQPQFSAVTFLCPPSLQLRPMPASGLRQDGTPRRTAATFSLTEDQLTSVSAAQIRCEIKYLLLIIHLLWSHISKSWGKECLQA